MAVKPITQTQLLEQNSKAVTFQSYTGTDIAVFVHVPDNKRLQRELSIIERLERELAEDKERLSKTTKITSTSAHIGQTLRSTLFERELTEAKAEKKELEQLLVTRAAARIAAVLTEEQILLGGKERTYPEQIATKPDADVQSRIDQLAGQITQLEANIQRSQQLTQSALQEERELRKSIRQTEEEISSINKRLEQLDVTKKVADLQTISYQSFRDKNPVRALGHALPKGFTRGGNTIAGTMVFTLFDRDVMFNLMGQGNVYDFENHVTTTTRLDQMPPLDITLLFASELGQASVMQFFGVEFVSNGSVMGVEDLMTESTVQFVARNYLPMRPLKDYKQRIFSNNTINFIQGTNLWVETPEYQRYKNNFNPFI